MKKLVKQRSSHPFPLPNSPNSGQQPSETPCTAVVHAHPRATLVSMLTILVSMLTRWGFFRGRDRWTEEGAPSCCLGTQDMLGRIHSQGPYLPGPWSYLLSPVSGGQWVCRARLHLLALISVDMSLSPSSAYVLCRALGHCLAQGSPEAVPLELLPAFVPCGFLFSLGLAHVVTEANFLC